MGDRWALLGGTFRSGFRCQERLAEPVEAAPQNARDLHLGDTDDVPDLLLRPLPVETQIEDVAVPLRKLLHQGRQGDGVDDATEGGVLGPEQTGERRVLVLSRRLLQRTRTALVHRAQRGQYVAVFESCVLRDLPSGGRTAAEPLLQFLDGLEHLAARLLQGAGQPYGGGTVAQVPPELTGDLGEGVRQKGVAECRIVAVDGLDQAQGRDLNEVVVVLPTALESACHAVGQRQQQADDLVSKGGPPRSPGLLGEVAHQRVELVRGRLRDRAGVPRQEQVGG